MTNEKKQTFENLPEEISAQPRFFRVGGFNKNKGGIWDNKIPIDEWNNIENQRCYNFLNFTDNRQLAGFDICGHGKATDYLVLDFDHVLDDNGYFVNDTAQKWYNAITNAVETYCELSISKHGLHFIFKPKAAEFSKMASGKKNSLYLSDRRDKDAPKIEIFYKPGGRYFLLTGNIYNCKPKTPIATDCGVVHMLIDKIKKRQTSPATDNRSANNPSDIKNFDNQSHARDMLKFIPCAELDYNDWVSVGMILKTNGNPIDDWIQWSAIDSTRFDEETCRYKWDTFKGAEGELTIATLCDMAKGYGYQPPTDFSNKIIELIKKKLEWEKSKGGKWRVSCTQHNLDLIFQHDPTIKNLIGYDEFYRQEVFLKEPFWKKNCIGDEWKNSDDSHLRHYLKKTYKDLKGNDTIFDTCVVFSRRNSFHPIKDYLESLKWDGTPRAETYFSKFLNVDDTLYTREITRKWLLGAISRVYHEGCDFQFALVLHGKQGIGKGYCLRMLGKKWYVSLTDSLDDSHALDTIERGWIIEIAELAAGRKAEINAQKAFLSDNADTRRKAYARRAETTPRHCVFGISVNDEHFLRDLTGNRRYKILECKSAQNEIVEGLTEEYVNQVWAEAFYMYRELFKDGFNDQLLRLSREMDAIADGIADKHIQDDGLQGEIAAFLSTKILPSFIWEHLTKEERRRFIANASIDLKTQELYQRIRAKFGKRTKAAQEQIDNIDAYIRQNLNTTIARIESNEQKKPDAVRNEQGDFYRFHGTEERMNTCAAEIFNECFGNDKRKNTNRINEVLASLDEWKRIDKRNKNFSSGYGQQRFYYEKIHTALIIT